MLLFGAENNNFQQSMSLRWASSMHMLYTCDLTETSQPMEGNRSCKRPPLFYSKEPLFYSKDHHYFTLIERSSTWPKVPTAK